MTDHMIEPREPWRDIARASERFQADIATAHVNETNNCGFALQITLHMRVGLYLSLPERRVVSTTGENCDACSGHQL